MKISEDMKKRFKSKAVWIAVLSQVLLLVALSIPELSDTVKVVGGSLIEIATLFGILNNPTETDKF